MEPLRSRRYPKARVDGTSVRTFVPGAEAGAGDYEPGDFILTHGRSFFSRLIRFGQGLWFWGPDRTYAWWSHVALIVSPGGDIVEAVGAGVKRAHISKYGQTDYQLVTLGALASPADRVQATTYAEWALGQKYGYLTIISITISLLVGGRFTFGYDGQSICSGLVARALERTSAIFDRSPSHIMPADLAKYFKAAPAAGAKRGYVPK